MSVLFIFSVPFCGETAVVQKLLAKTGCRLLDEKTIVDRAAKNSALSEEKIQKAFSAKTSVFNPFTHEKETSVAHLKRALAEMISEDNWIVTGPVGFLIPAEMAFVCRVCLVADLNYSVQTAMACRGLKAEEAVERIHQWEDDNTAWFQMLGLGDDLRASSLYDLVVPTDKTAVEEVVARIIQKSAVAEANAGLSKSDLNDFLLSSRVEAALADQGHHVGVVADSGAVELTIRQNVLGLEPIEEAFHLIVDKIPGVRSVAVSVSAEADPADVYCRYDPGIPSKILLVDDEREFVQTLCERLIMRDMGAVVVHDGESAMNMVRDDDPEVMILDIRMPGIDGIEVLRRVKEIRPEIEVIMLTGHGSETDRQLCMELGAFAYMHKPVDIQMMIDTLKEAHDKIQRNKD